MKSKFSLIEGNSQVAFKLLFQAGINAEENDLLEFANRVEKERINLEKELEKWYILAKQSASISDIISETHIIDYIKELQNF